MAALRRRRGRQVEAPVRTRAVVVLDLAVQDLEKLPPPGDQEVVQALLTHGANPALGHGVSVGRLDRRQDDLSAEPMPHLVEGSGELAGTVRIRNRMAVASSSSAETRLRACRATRAPVGLAVTPARWTRRL